MSPVGSDHLSSLLEENWLLVMGSVQWTMLCRWGSLQHSQAHMLWERVQLKHSFLVSVCC